MIPPITTSDILDEEENEIKRRMMRECLFWRDCRDSIIKRSGIGMVNCELIKQLDIEHCEIIQKLNKSAMDVIMAKIKYYQEKNGKHNRRI